MEREQAAESTSLAQVAAEALALAGGGRALLLQIAHPAIGRGVVEHSDFANRVMDRFHATMTFVYAGTFGTPEEFAAVRRQVNRAHAPVRAEQSGDEPAYNAFDPELQLWVSATLYRTMMDLYAHVYGPLSPEDAQRVYQEFTGTGTQLQIPAEAWPPTAADFDAYWDGMVRTLRVTDGTRAVSRQILHPRNVPIWLRLVLPEARLLTAGLLPPSVREQFELPWNERLNARFERRMRWTAAVYPRLPAWLRHGPRDAYLRRLRRSLARAGSNGSDASAIGRPGRSKDGMAPSD